MSHSYLIKLALRLLKRDWRAGELRLLGLAVIVAVTCMTSVSFFTDRISRALQYQASELLGADLRITMEETVRAPIMELAHRHRLRTARTKSFRSMLIANNKSQLAEVKAVSDGYPLRGKLKIADRAFSHGQPTASIPQPGSAWLGPIMLSKLGVKLGDWVTLGKSRFKVTSVLVYEPDRASDMFSIAPRVLINAQDLAATGLIQEGSRIAAGLLVAGEEESITLFRDEVKPLLVTSDRIETVQDARQEVRIALQRAHQFLSLASVISVILACVAIALSSRRYVHGHLDACAIMRCYGASQNTILAIYLVQFIAIGVLASGIGCVLAYFSQIVLAKLLGSLLLVQLPAPSIWPALTGLVTGVVGLLGFAMPSILQLRGVPTLRVIRRNFGLPSGMSMSSYAVGVTGISAMILWQTGEIKLGLILCASVVATVALLWLVSALLIRIISKMSFSRYITLRFGVGNIVRRKTATNIQIVSFGVGIMSMLVFSVVRVDLLDSWLRSLPEDASNRFVINIQENQTEAVQRFFAQQQMNEVNLYPMVRGRLLSIDTKTIADSDHFNEHARRLATRVFNLSWNKDLQEDNKVVAGKWWGEKEVGQPQFSVEQGLANNLGIGVGSTLRFDIAGESIEARVTSLRTVKWDSLKPNFFVITPPGVLDQMAKSYFTSFHLDDARVAVLDKLISQFPNLTVIDVSAIMKQIRTIIHRVSLAVEYVFIFTLITGLIVMYAAIQSTQWQRNRENALLKSIGASHRQLFYTLVSEFFTLGLIAGLLAGLVAFLVGQILAQQVLDLNYQAQTMTWVIGVASSVLGVAAAGIIATRGSITKPPIAVLRDN